MTLNNNALWRKLGGTRENRLTHIATTEYWLRISLLIFITLNDVCLELEHWKIILTTFLKIASVERPHQIAGGMSWNGCDTIGTLQPCYFSVNVS